jgi:hypothetical protein
VVIAIIQEKIEGFTEFFNENQDVFTQIHQFYNGNKKILELTNEIVTELNGGKIKKREEINLLGDNNISTNETRSYSGVDTKAKNLTNYTKTITNEDTTSNSDKNSSLSQENTSKFNFIKKKGNNKSEVENMLNSVNGNVNKSEDLFGNLNSKTSDKNATNSGGSTSKFSFIKSKKPNEEISLTTNNNTQNNNGGGINYKYKYKNILIIIGFNLSSLNEELNEAFTAATTNNFCSNVNMNTNTFINPLAPINQQPLNFNYNHTLMNNIDTHVLNPTNPMGYYPDKKHYPANFDMLFNTNLLNSPIGGDIASNTNINNTLSPGSITEIPSDHTKKEYHFNFVDDLLKPKK